MEEEEDSVNNINSNDDVNGGGGELNDVAEHHEEEEEEEETSRVFSELKPYCLEILGLLQNPAATASTAIPSLLLFLRRCPSASLQPLFDYTLLPLLLLLDAAVDCRSSKKSNIVEKGVANTTLIMPQKVSDRVAEGALQCLEELLKKCHFGSVEQMVAVMKKLTFAALLSPFEASEEFREGVIKCFRALLLGLLPCTDEVCVCRQVIGLPALLETGDMQSLQPKHSKFSSKQGKCLLAYLQSETAAAAVGHWLSLLLKAADTEATRGHRGSAKLRIEAFFTLRVLVAKVGTSDALAFFLPGVVSQFAKVLHVSKTMISGAAGNVEAIDHAIRGLAEYLMIVLEDDANLSSLDMSLNVMVGTHANKDASVCSFLDELRQLPVSAKGQSKTEGNKALRIGYLLVIVNSLKERKEVPSHGTGVVNLSSVGTSDALAFFLPGVVSQFAKVLHVSKTMISGAAGNVEAIDHAIRGLAEYLMIVLEDDANLSSLDMSLNVMVGTHANKDASVCSFLDELRQLPVSAKGQSKTVAEESSGEALTCKTPASGFNRNRSAKSQKDIGSLHVNRTREWIEKTSLHVDKLLTATFPHICVNPTKRVRQGLVAAIQGLLSKCIYALKDSRLMLLECLCILVVDDCEEISVPAQQFMECLFSSSGKNLFHSDVAAIFNRLIEKLPKVVLGNEEALAVSCAQQLLVVIYYSGPKFLLNYLHSPVTSARFLDVFSLCLSQRSVFTGALDKHISTGSSSVGYLHSIAELKASSHFITDHQRVMGTVPSQISKFREIKGHEPQYLLEAAQNNYELPHMPPWFGHVGGHKLYQALAGILRLVGLSLMTDFDNEGHMSVVTDVPLGYLRKLVSEVRVEYNRESWLSWYNRTGSGQLLRQASTAACILNEMIFGLSDKAVNDLARMFQNSRDKREKVQESNTKIAAGQACAVEYPEPPQSIWKVSQGRACRSHLVDCVGRILHEYLSSELWDLPEDHKSLLQPDYEVKDLTLHFFHDTAVLHQVIIEGIGVFAMCLGNEFTSSGYLHSSLYLLLESLVRLNSRVRSASDAVLHVLSSVSGYPTVGQLVLSNADYVIDSVCQQLRHLDFNPHVPDVLASMLSYIGVAQRILPLLEEPMRSASQELEILGRHQHPELTIPFLKAVSEISKALRREASTLPANAKSYLMQVMSKASSIDKEMRPQVGQGSMLHHNKAEQWESIVVMLNDSRRYRQTVGSIAGSCLTAATPLLASMNQAACLVALDIVEEGIATLAKVEEAYRHEKEAKEAIEEVIQLNSLYEVQDTLDAAQEGTDENRLLPAMNKIWPFLVVCVRNKNPVAVRRCLSVVGNVVEVCGGDFFSRRFLTDGSHFWKLLSSSPFHKKPFSREERTPLQLPYRIAPTSAEDSMAEVSNLKVQVAVLNMIADLSRNGRSASALEVVLKKVSGLVVGIACSGVAGLQEASINALHGLASIDPDLIWLLLVDVYYSLKKKDLPSPPTADFPDISQILPPPSSTKGFLYVQYGGQSYGFDVDFSAVETVFKKLHLQAFANQMYI